MDCMTEYVYCDDNDCIDCPLLNDNEDGSEDATRDDPMTPKRAAAQDSIISPDNFLVFLDSGRYYRQL